MEWSLCCTTSFVGFLIKLLFAFIVISSCVPVDALSRDEFYPFGSESGDTSMIARYNLGSPPIQPMVTDFPLFGQSHDTFFVFGGGYITFNTSTSYYPYRGSFPHTSFGIVLPFWSYGFYRTQSQVWYRTTTDSTLLERAKRDVQRAFINQDNFQPLWLLIATWEDVHVDYYYYYYDDDFNRVTFQCVLATDGVQSFAIFHYEEEMSRILSFRSHQLQMGYNAGDGIHYYQHPLSFSIGLFDIFNTSNVRIPGVWIFRLDDVDTPIVQCSTQSYDPISLVPRTGNMLGGTAVVVTGPCLNSTDSISCSFGNKAVPGVYIDETSLLCVSPSLSRVGEVSFQLKITKTINNRVQELTYVSHFNSVSPDKGHIVDILSSAVTFQSKAKIQVSWPPDKLIPRDIPLNSSLISVSVSLYRQQYTYLPDLSSWEAEWQHLETPVKSIKNSIGRAEVAFPSSQVECFFPLPFGGIKVGLCPIAVKVSVNKVLQDRIPFSLPTGIGIWSGIVFLQTDRTKSEKLRTLCEEWGVSEQARRQSGQVLLDRVLTCPPTLNLARFDPNFEKESYLSVLGSTQYSSQIMSFLHPNIDVCFLQVTPNQNSTHQCCYRNNGNLVLGAPGGGSVDSISSKVDFNRHLSDDMIPFLLCCKAGNGFTNCDEYYQWRPSGKENETYTFPVPACIYGDPHIITLDGLKYTFNGKGEFTMIETTDNSFTLQGRMEPTQDQDGNPTPGTVFTALAARENFKNTTVQFELQSGGVSVLVDGNEVEFDEITEVIFDSVTVADNGNNTVSAQFSGGAKMEVTVENDIISIMLITLPDGYKEMTQGLMGSFNGDSSDDLVPKSLNKPISINSSLEDIHNHFGLTWIINDPVESIFTYKEGESWETFYDPSFSPTFKPTFEDPELEEEAKEVCGDDKSCLFDVAATKKVEIGMATMRGVESFDSMVEMSVPIVCNPPCVNGVCVKNDTCSCNDGFEGEKCNSPVVSECDVNMCQNNGTCMKHVLTYTCDCPAGFIGAFCQEKEPPFHVQLLNSSPRFNGGVLLIDFKASMPIVSAQCFLTGQKEKNCKSGQVQYIELPAGTYIFRVQAKTRFGERAVVRRIIHVGEAADNGFCAVHLINEGIVVQGMSASLFFKGTKAVDEYRCRLRGNTTDTGFSFCRSPARFQDLEVGEYRFQVIPVGCDKGKRLSVKFNIF